MVFSDILSSTGSVASIGGLIITIVVMINVRRIRKGFLFRARFPELLGRLENYTNELPILLESFNANRTEIEQTLSACNADLRNLSTKIDNKFLRNDIVKLMRMISDVGRVELESKEIVSNIFLKLSFLVQSLKNFKNDQDWR